MMVDMVYTGGRLRPLTPKMLERFKSGLSDGQKVTAEFFATSDEKQRSDRAFRLLHALINRYAKALGSSAPAAKDELCCLYGVAMKLPEDLTTVTLPTWPGHLVQPWDDGKMWIRKSTNAYSVGEMNALISGIGKACMENGIEIGDLV